MQTPAKVKVITVTDPFLSSLLDFERAAAESQNLRIVWATGLAWCAE